MMDRKKEKMEGIDGYLYTKEDCIKECLQDIEEDMSLMDDEKECVSEEIRKEIEGNFAESIDYIVSKVPFHREYAQGDAGVQFCNEARVAVKLKDGRWAYWSDKNMDYIGYLLLFDAIVLRDPEEVTENFDLKSFMEPKVQQYLDDEAMETELNML